MSQPQANYWVLTLLPVLQATLGREVALPLRPATGKTHDKTLAEADAIPYPPGSHGAGDLGYQGHAPPNLSLAIPIKTPRGGVLTEEERALNTRLAQLRIPVEHAIRGVKISRMAAEVFRNTKEGLADVVIEIAAGLYNWKSRRRGHVLPVAS